MKLFGLSHLSRSHEKKTQALQYILVVQQTALPKIRAVLRVVTGAHCPLCAPVAFVSRRVAAAAHRVEYRAEENSDARLGHAVPVVTAATRPGAPQVVVYCPTPAHTSVEEKRLAKALAAALKYTL